MVTNTNKLIQWKMCWLLQRQHTKNRERKEEKSKPKKNQLIRSLYAIMLHENENKCRNEPENIDGRTLCSEFVVNFRVVIVIENAIVNQIWNVMHFEFDTESFIVIWFEHITVADGTIDTIHHLVCVCVCVVLFLSVASYFNQNDYRLLSAPL